MIPAYENIEKREVMIREVSEIKDDIRINFVKGPMVEILGSSTRTYDIQFIDADKNDVIYRDSFLPNHWAKASRKCLQYISYKH